MIKLSGVWKFMAAGLLWFAAGAASGDAPAGWFEGPLNPGWTNGAAVFSGMDFDVTGYGADNWGVSDCGYAVFKPFVGDCEIIADIPEPSRTGYWASNSWCRAALVMREGQMDGDAGVAFARLGGVEFGGAALEAGYRTAYGEKMARWPDFKARYASEDSGRYHVWGYGGDGGGYDGYARLRRVRQGDIFTAWASSNENFTVWQKIAEVTNAFKPGMLVGIAVNPRSTSHSLTTRFRNVKARSLVTAEITNGMAAVSRAGGELPINDSDVSC